MSNLLEEFKYNNKHLNLEDPFSDILTYTDKYSQHNLLSILAFPQSKTDIIEIENYLNVKF